MARTFTIAPGVHAPQLAIQACDLTLNECRMIETVVCNQRTDSQDYVLARAASPFLQGYEPPIEHDHNNGWALVEFWSNNRGAIEAWVHHLERRLAEMIIDD